ncbi:MAG: amidase, partial [Aestuariibacter sp.]|nr:amidase [Aestuariibacter sp.]
GSSGGAAAALATGETWLSQGSDHGGSLRTPAAYCGVVGLRPSPGRVPFSLEAGISAGYSIEPVIGPMARSVRDCALFLDTMSGFDPGLPISFPAPATSFQDAVMRSSSKIRIAFSADLNGFAPVEKDIDAQLREALRKVAAEGATVVEDCPELPNLERSYHVLRGLGFMTSFGTLPESTSRHFKETIKENLAFAKTLTLEDIVKVNIDRTTIYLNMQNLLHDFDVLACPTVGNMPRLVELEWVDEINAQKLTNYMDWLRFAFLATTTGLPAISVPVGLSNNGMPVGMQLIGPARGEAKLLAAARIVEQATGGPLGPIDPNKPGA